LSRQPFHPLIERQLTVSAPLLDMAHEVVPTAVIVRATGEIDMATAPEFLAQLREACELARSGQNVVVDLTGVSFFGSAGLSVLLQIHERCDALSTPLRVVASSHVVIRTLRVTAMDRVLRLVDSLDGAVASA
jgi:anti-sigma B factor antagonist